MLTNFQTIKKQIRRLRELEQGAADGDFENYTKKEKLLFERERVKLSRNLEGIKQMGRLPGALFIVDAKKEKIAVAEANKLGIPVVAIVDTNADPDVITVPMPGNDDAIRSVSLITAALSDVINESRAQMPLRETAEDLDAETYSTDAGSEGDADADRKRRRPAGSGGPSPRPLQPASRPMPTVLRSRRPPRRPRATAGVAPGAGATPKLDVGTMEHPPLLARAGRERRFYYSPRTGPGWRP